MTQPYLSFATTCVHYQDSTEGSHQLMDENQLAKAEPEQESGYMLGKLMYFGKLSITCTLLWLKAHTVGAVSV